MISPLLRVIPKGQKNEEFKNAVKLSECLNRLKITLKSKIKSKMLICRKSKRSIKLINRSFTVANMI